MSRPMVMNKQVETVSPVELLSVITDAASQNPALVQTSSKRLKEMLELFGTFDGLSEISGQTNIPLRIRQQAIIQFKNAALTHWRSRKVLSDEQRVRIRARCLTFVNEEDDLIAQCNEVIVAKIARADFPEKWPNLVTDLTGLIDTKLQSRYASLNSNSHTNIVLHRSLRILNEVIKELASAKLPKGLQTMGSIVDSLHLVMYGYYSKVSSAFASALDASGVSSSRVAEDLLVGHLIFKILAKMAAWLWNKTPKMGRDEADRTLAWLGELFQNSVIQLKTLTELRINLIVALRSSNVPPDQVARRSIDQLTRHVRLFGKFFRRLQQTAVARFVALPMCADLVLYYWSKVVQATSSPPELVADTNESVFPVRFLVQALVLFRESLAQWAPVRKDGSPNKHTLSREFVENAVRLLVTRFIPLNPSDLEEWVADPEEWMNMEDPDNEQWEYHLRPCGERVLMTLSNQYRQYVTPLLENTFKQIQAQPMVDLPSIIQKEALYCAIGRCAIRLKDVIQFDQWLDHNLLPEARDTNPNYPIIKRRIAWLIGKWISDDCSSPNNPQIWETLVHLIRDREPGTDAVVRLTAAVALGKCVNKTGCNADVFAPFLPSAVTELVRILGEAEALESKRRVAESLDAIIQRANYRIVPLLQTIVEPLPKLWTAAGEDWVLKKSVLIVVTNLVNSAKEHSTSLSAIVVPLVRESLLPGVQLHLDQDGLSLWQSTLFNTLTIESINGAPGLIDIFPLAIGLLAENLDLLGKIIGIHESYYLLDGSRILQSFPVDLFRAFLAALSNPSIMNTNTKDIIIAIDLLIQVTPSSLWGEALHVTGLFAHLLKTLTDSEISVAVRTELIYLMSRIAFADRQMFLQLMSATTTLLNKTESSLYEGLLDQWWLQFDHMRAPRLRKLVAMGIASLVATGCPEVLRRLPTEIFNLWTDVFCELKEILDVSDGSSPPPSPGRWDEDERLKAYFNGTEGTLEYDRRKAVYDRGPVRTTQLTVYIAAMLHEAEVASGGAQAFQDLYLAKADPLLLNRIQRELVRD